MGRPDNLGSISAGGPRTPVPFVAAAGTIGEPGTGLPAACEASSHADRNEWPERPYAAAATVPETASDTPMDATGERMTTGRTLTSLATPTAARAAFAAKRPADTGSATAGALP